MTDKFLSRGAFMAAILVTFVGIVSAGVPKSGGLATLCKGTMAETVN